MLERPVRTTQSGAQDAGSGWAADPSIEIKRPIIGSLLGWPDLRSLNENHKLVVVTGAL